MTTLLFLVAAGAGAAVRFSLAVRLNRRLPIGTFVANLAAAFALGVLAPLDNDLDPLVRIGLLGALSTWSTLALEVSEMLRRNEQAEALVYLSATVVSGIGAAWLGLQL